MKKKKKTSKNVYGVHEEDRVGDREKEKMKRERSFDFPSTNRDRGTFIAVAVYHIGVRMYNHQKALIIRWLLICYISFGPANVTPPYLCWYSSTRKNKYSIKRPSFQQAEVASYRNKPRYTQDRLEVRNFAYVHEKIAFREYHWDMCASECP